MVLACLIGAADRPSEYQVKAALVYNFTRFTTWPERPTQETNRPLTIAILGEDPFGGALDDMVRGEKVRGRTISIQRFPQGTLPSGACDLVFIARSETSRREEILGHFRGQAVLTVADQTGFCEAGGMVNLALTRDQTVQPEINPTALHAAKLEISSRVLNLPMIRLVTGHP